MKSKNVNDLHDFLFEIHLGKEIKQFRHDILGIPMLPNIGKYFQSGYEFSAIYGLITISLDIKQNENKEISFSFEDLGQKYSVTLPPEIIKHYTGFSDVIPINKVEEEEGEKKQQNYNNQKKNNKEKMPQNQKNKNFERGNFGFSNKLNLRIIFLNNSYLSTIKKNKFLTGFDVYNIIPHPFHFPKIELDEKKRKGSKFIPTSILLNNSSKSVQKFDESRNKSSKHLFGISCTGFRYEISNIHMRGMSLCFSPNNLRFHLNEKEEIADFWLGILGENRIENELFYYIAANSNNAADLLQQSLNESNSLQQLLQNLEIFFKGKEFVDNLKLIFSGK